MAYKNWDDMSIEDQADFDAWEEAFLAYLRQLQEESAAHDKMQILNPKRVKEFESAVKNLKQILKPYMRDSKLSIDATPLSQSGVVRVTLPDVFETSNLLALCNAAQDSDHIEIGVAFGKIYMDFCFRDLLHTEYMD